MASWNIEIVWHGECPDGVEDKVESDIAVELRDLSRPSDLVFHTVWLSDDIDGPSVVVWGEPGDGRFHAEYSDRTEFETLGAA